MYSCTASGACVGVWCGSGWSGLLWDALGVSLVVWVWSGVGGMVIVWEGVGSGGSGGCTVSTGSGEYKKKTDLYIECQSS